jgi:hypothetical protein
MSGFAQLDAIQAENVRLQTEMMTLREAEAHARETRPSAALAASAGVRKAPRATRSSRTVPTAKAATRRKKAV